jgi:hypothetical protein
MSGRSSSAAPIMSGLALARSTRLAGHAPTR